MNAVRHLGRRSAVNRAGRFYRASGLPAILLAAFGCIGDLGAQEVKPLRPIQPQPPVTLEDARSQMESLEITIQVLPFLSRRNAGQAGANDALGKEIEAKQGQLQAIVNDMSRDYARAVHARDYQAELSQSYLRDFAKRREAAYSAVQTLAGRENTEILRQGNRLDATPRPAIQTHLRQAEGVRTEFLAAFGKKIADTAAELGADHPQVRELEARYDRLSTMVGQVVDAYRNAQTAKTDLEAAFYLKSAGSMEDSINRVAHGVFDKSPFADRPPSGATGPDLIQGIEPSLYGEHEMLLNWKEDAPRQSDVAGLLKQAERDFGEGRAGAGDASRRKPESGPSGKALSR